MTLNVFLFDDFVGTLSTTSNRGIVFQYDTEYVSKKGQPLSLSLPLRNEEFSQKECIPYFTGLLPEGAVKTQVSNYFHIAESSTIKLLELLGGECSGTVTFFNCEDFDVDTAKSKISKSWKLNDTNYRKLSKSDIANYVREIDVKPFIKSDDNLRLSLAGAQNKVSLAYFDNEWYLPLHGAPSTHILKPSIGFLKTISANEFICMKLAELFGLEVPSTQLDYFEGLPMFITSRYDRIYNEEQKQIQRLHQEDLCQAMGILNTEKYQCDGGPSLTDTYNFVINNCSHAIRITSRIIDIILYNYLIGNCDAHGKNFSILYQNDNSYEFAPFYDLVSTEVYHNYSTKMAMKLGNEYEINNIMKSNFTKQANSMNIKPYAFFNQLEKFRDTYMEAFKAIEEFEELKDYKDLVQQIKKNFIEKLDKLQC